MLVDVRTIDTSTTVLGQRIELPVFVAPMGRHKNFHPEGEAATARGAAAANTIFTLPTYSTTKFADVAKARESLTRLLKYNFDTVLVGDGTSILGGGKEAVRRAVEA